MSRWTWPGVALPDGDRPGETIPCQECGLPHSLERRVEVLRRMLPCTVAAVVAAWPHLLGERKAVQRTLRAMGAVRVGETWCEPQKEIR